MAANARAKKRRDGNRPLDVAAAAERADPGRAGKVADNKVAANKAAASRPGAARKKAARKKAARKAPAPQAAPAKKSFWDKLKPTAGKSAKQKMIDRRRRHTASRTRGR